MYQPTTDVPSHDTHHERETVIKFVISGPYLNAEAAHAQWPAEPPPSSSMQELVRRIADLERRLDEERALVQALSSQMPAVPTPAPSAHPTPEPAPLAERAQAVATATVAGPLAEPTPRFSFKTVAEPAPEPTLLSQVQAVAEQAARMAEPPPPAPPLSPVAQTPPPKVRGLRRMIGALRRL